MLLCGQTGVGKTELAKELATALEGTNVAVDLPIAQSGFYKDGLGEGEAYLFGAGATGQLERPERIDFPALSEAVRHRRWMAEFNASYEGQQKAPRRRLVIVEGHSLPCCAELLNGHGRTVLLNLTAPHEVCCSRRVKRESETRTESEAADISRYLEEVTAPLYNEHAGAALKTLDDTTELSVVQLDATPPLPDVAATAASAVLQPQQLTEMDLATHSDRRFKIGVTSYFFPWLAELVHDITGDWILGDNAVPVSTEQLVWGKKNRGATGPSPVEWSVANHCAITESSFIGWCLQVSE